MSLERLPRLVGGIGLVVAAISGGATVASAQAPARTAGEVTYTNDIAPILQRSCVQCHNPDGGAPMPLTTYEEVRPYARAIKTRTAMGPRAGVMPPWFVEKNIGIQHYKGDLSLSDEEIARVCHWADSGAPRGNPADMPAAKASATRRRRLGARQAGSGGASRPRSSCQAVAPDRWGRVG